MTTKDHSLSASHDGSSVARCPIDRLVERDQRTIRASVADLGAVGAD